MVENSDSISAVVLAHKDSEQLRKCLSLLNWVDELILIDSSVFPADLSFFSRLIPKCKVFKRELDLFCRQRNFAIDQSGCSWILHIDSDEVVSEELSLEIRNRIASAPADVAAFNARLKFFWKKNRLSFMDGPKGFGAILHRKGSASFIGAVHEVMQIHGSVRRLTHPVLHISEESVLDRVAKAVHYARKEIDAHQENKTRGRGIQDVFLSPIRKFLGHFFLRRAYRDGVPGLVWAVLECYALFIGKAAIWGEEQNKRPDRQIISGQNESL